MTKTIRRALVVSMFDLPGDMEGGGADRFIVELVLALTRLGFWVDLLVPYQNGRQHRPESPARVTRHPLLRSWQKGVRYSPADRKADLEALRRLSCDVDVVVSVDRPLPIEVEAPSLLFVLTLAYPDVADSVFYDTHDGIAVPSQYLFAVIGALAGPSQWDGDPPKMFHVPLPIDTFHFQPVPATRSLDRALGVPSAARLLLSAHRPDPRKGATEAVAVLAALRARSEEDWRLLIPAPRDAAPAFLSELRRRAAAQGIGSEVILHPWLPYRQLPAYLSRGDWLLRLGSFPEGFGLVVLMAIACGTPTLCTPFGAIPELLPTSPALRLVPPDDAEIAAITILKEIPTRADLADARGEIARKYSRAAFMDAVDFAVTTTTKGCRTYRPRDTGPERPWVRTLEDGRRWDEFREGVV